MSLVKRSFASVVNRSAGGSAGAFPRSLLATVAVVGGWLSINLVAYGSLVMPGDEAESLLAERGSRASARQPVASLPVTPFFGVAEVKAKVESEPEIDLANIPVTQLNLVLSGVLSSSKADRASALVAERGKAAERVYVGQTLPGGAEVYSVEVDHIILRRNGQMEKLTYPDADGRPAVPKQYANLARQAAQAIGATGAADRSDQQQSIRDKLEQLRDMARTRQANRNLR